ncbi:MAG: N-6 DNA methylase [Promethearchaeota archaeon]
MSRINYPNFHFIFNSIIQDIKNQKDISKVFYKQWKNSIIETLKQNKDEKELKDLFNRHTYLFYFSIIITAKILGLNSTSSAFRELGILNFPEKESYYNWLPDQIKSKLIQMVENELERYAFLDVDEDFLRLAYEYILSPGERHRLGEFYTPQWLAEILVKKVLEIKPEIKDLSFLDPGCGPGTFLTIILKEKLKNRISINNLSSEIIGFDINPIAVHIAKANYLISIKRLINPKERVSFNIPIYLTDFLSPSDSVKKYYYQFDIIIGNPPWLTYKDIDDPTRQEILDSFYSEYKLCAKAENKTQMDLAIFFTIMAQDFCKEDYLIAFVFTRSLFDGAQYNAVRKGIWKGPFIETLFDIKENANPFRKPSCMVIFNSTYKSIIEGYEILDKEYDMLKPMTYYINYTANESAISTKKIDLLHASPYKNLFKNGATLYPRSYFFIEVLEEDDEMIIVRTSNRYGPKASKKYRKENWMIIKRLSLPKLFLYEVVLGECIEKFKLKGTMKVILPIIPLGSSSYKFYFKQIMKGNSYVIDFKNDEMDYETKLLNASYLHTLQHCERDWERIKGKKFNINSDKKNLRKSILDNINHNKKLINQKPDYNYIVLYNRSGSTVRAAVTNKKRLIIAGTVNYAYIDKKEEAYYLVAMLNSKYLLDRIKTIGIKSERHIQKKLFEIPIPKFCSEHRQKKLAALAEACKTLNKTMEELVEDLILNPPN